MYTSESDWLIWQERGFYLLKALYDKTARLQSVQVQCCLRSSSLCSTMVLNVVGVDHTVHAHAEHLCSAVS